MHEIVESLLNDNYYHEDDMKSESPAMYVCLCNGVTDTEITALLAEGDKGMRDLRQELKVGTQCGRCTCLARQMVNRFYQISEPDSSARVTHLHLCDEPAMGSDSRQVA